jgi:hypothetical protein
MVKLKKTKKKAVKIVVNSVDIEIVYLLITNLECLRHCNLLN